MPVTFALCEWLHPGDGAVDVGAHVGEYARALAAAVGPSGMVMALEPDPETADRCRAQCVSAPQIVVRQVAVTDREGTATLYRDAEDRRRNSLWRANVVRDEGGAVTVPTMTLDAIVADVPRLAGIKIDAQGAEALILRGSEQTLARDGLTWFVEIWTVGVANSGARIDEVLDAFRAHGLGPVGNDWAHIASKARDLRGHGSFDILVRKT